jgi:hypothetical protein
VNLGRFANADDLLSEEKGMHIIHSEMSAGLARFRIAAMKEKLLSDDEVWESFISAPRVLFARNPYVRFLSSYLDWLRRNEDKHPNLEETVPFAEFVKKYQKWDLFGTHWYADHIQPVSQVCKHSVMQYDIIYRLEEQALWFDTFLETHGLKEHVEQMQVSLYTSALSADSTVKSYLRPIVGLDTWGGEIQHTGHVRNSAQQLGKYYDADTARLVFDLQRSDFEAFGYPVWNGNPDEFRFV